MAAPRRAVVLALVVALAGCGDERRRAEPEREGVISILQDDAELLHRSPERIARNLDDIRELGVDWVRITAGWSVLAPEPLASHRPAFDATDPDAYPGGAWDAIDHAVDAAHERGLDVAIDIAFWAPRWAVTTPSPDPARERWGIIVADYTDFATAVARRYPDAAAFTIWNEPNLSTFWLPQFQRSGGRWLPASPHAYRDLVYDAVPAVKAAAPGALVLIGATSSLGVEEGTASDDRMSPLVFLREMACVDAALKPLDRPECSRFTPLPGDGWSHHPYSGGLAPYEHDDLPQTVRMADLDRLTGLLQQLGDAGRTERVLPLYITEYGYQTNPPDPTWATSPVEQARWLSEAERIARDNELVRSTAQFELRDLPPHPPPDPWSDFQSGLQFDDGSDKPAYAAYALPLVARRSGDGVAFWGLVRGARGGVAVEVQARGGDGAWATVAEAITGDDGTFEVSAQTDPSATFRVAAGGRVGAPLPGAR